LATDVISCQVPSSFQKLTSSQPSGLQRRCQPSGLQRRGQPVGEGQRPVSDGQPVGAFWSACGGSQSANFIHGRRGLPSQRASGGYDCSEHATIEPSGGGVLCHANLVRGNIVRLGCYQIPLGGSFALTLKLSLRRAHTMRQPGPRAVAPRGLRSFNAHSGKHNLINER
jgi:hypothetical protein